jgi:hypothetical protein
MQDVIDNTPTNPDAYYDLFDDGKILESDLNRINVALVIRDMFLLVSYRLKGKVIS